MMMMMMMMMMATTIGNKILETKSTHLNLWQDFISSCLPAMSSFTPTMSCVCVCISFMYTHQSSSSKNVAVDACKICEVHLDPITRIWNPKEHDDLGDVADLGFGQQPSNQQNSSFNGVKPHPLCLE